MIVLFLTGMVAMIMLRTLHRDIAKYNQLETAEEAQEETGWKLVHGDVFRAPPRASLLASLVGTGVQLLGMSVVTMIFAVLGFLSPANRGGLMTAMLLLFVFMGIFGGFFAARLYRQFKGGAWRAMTLRTSLLFPGTASVVFFSLNLLVWGQASSGAVPFSTLFALIFLWFGISVPLVFTGSYLGFKRDPLEDPVCTNKIPRQARHQPLRVTTGPLLWSQACVANWHAKHCPVAGASLMCGAADSCALKSGVRLAGAGPAVVHEPSVLVPHRRHPALWRCVHRALLHPHLHVAPHLLLHLWLLGTRVPHPGRHVRRNHHRAVLLPAVQRRLPLVVAIVLHGGVVSIVPVLVFGLLLLHEARHHQDGANADVLWVHARGVVWVFLRDGDNRLLRMLPVCAHHLCGGQD